MSQKIEQAWSLLNEGEIEKAFDVAKKLFDKDSSPEVLLLVGCCQKVLKQYRFAAINIQKSLNIKPLLPGANVALAECLYFMGHINDAVNHYNFALSKNLDIGIAHCGLGRITTDREQALKHFKLAVKHEPDNPEFLTKLGTCLAQFEKVQQGCEAFEQALIINPMYHQATSGLAMLYAREREYGKVVDCVKKLIEHHVYDGNAANAFLLSSKKTDSCLDAIRYAKDCLPSQADHVRQSIHVQIAHIYDYLKEYEKAWDHLVEAKRLIKVTTKYNSKAQSDWIGSIINTFTPETLMKFPQADTRQSIRPIFIIGMPRSGTSLTEQILSAHPEVFGCGELTFLSDIANQIPAIIQSGNPWPLCASELTLNDVNKIRKLYLDKLPSVGHSINFITDKMPHNFFVVGLIRLICPDASIIHCKRNAMDTGLSLFFQDFEEGHDYCANLYDIGTHYYQYRRLMNHWKSIYPDKIYDVNYEDVVEEPEKTIRGLLSFCDLVWDESCLNFNQTGRTVRTASFDQVHQPLYKKSIERWRNYEQHLGDLKNGLELGI